MKSFGFMLAILLAVAVWLCSPGAVFAHGCGNRSNNFDARNFSGGGRVLDIQVNSRRGFFGLRRGPDVRVRAF